MTVWPEVLPTSRVPYAMDAPALRWGILGPGWISHNFVKSLKTYTQQEVVAVGSRSIDSARQFAATYTIPHAHGSYEDLVNDPSVDIIYVATPHNFHAAHGLMAIEAGKHVLIEKPIALNSDDLNRLFRAAETKGVMCQEAFWSFFLPKFDVIRQVLDAGMLGDVVTVIADHGEWLPPDHRIHNAELAGGSLHDLGVYVFALSAWVAGAPVQTFATGRRTDTGVMGDVAVAMTSRAGTISSLSTTMMTTTPCRAIIAGSEATLTTDEGFFFPGGFTLTHHHSGRVLRFDEPNIRHGALYFEAAEVAHRIADGQITSPCWTPDNSRDTTRTLDAVNIELGLG